LRGGVCWGQPACGAELVVRSIIRVLSCLVHMSCGTPDLTLALHRGIDTPVGGMAGWHCPDGVCPLPLTTLTPHHLCNTVGANLFVPKYGPLETDRRVSSPSSLPINRLTTGMTNPLLLFNFNRTPPPAADWTWRWRSCLFQFLPEVRDDMIA